MTLPQAVIDHLIERYQPLAIIQHGSRVRGDAGQNSDYDVTLLTATDAESKPYTQDGMMIDLSDERPDVAVLDAKGEPIWPLAVLYDVDGSGAALAKRTKTEFDIGPDALSAQEIENRKNFIRRAHARLLARGGDPALRLYYKGILVERFVRYYFETQQRWTMSPHLMVTAIKGEDPAYAAALDELSDRYYEKAVERLYEMLFNEELV